MSGRERGFSLITAVFLLVVVAALVVYMANIRSVQQTTLLYGVQGARALQAARSGLEWGIYDALTNDACPAATTITFPASETALSAFSVSVSCSDSLHTEGGIGIRTFRLTSIARSGSYGTLDYVQRYLQATVSDDPP